MSSLKSEDRIKKLKETLVVKYFINLFNKFTAKAKKVTFPGFDGIPLYDVLLFLFRGIIEGSITTRASAIAFNFYLAIFPAIIFVFTLIPFIPVENFQTELLSLLREIMPSNAYLTLQSTLEDIIINQQGSWLSIGFIAALFFSTNGFNSMIDAFNASRNSVESRSWLAQRSISLILVFIIFTLTLTAVMLMVSSRYVVNWMVDYNILHSGFSLFLIIIGKWITIILLFFFAISFQYYLAPAKKTRWRFFSAGSTLATLLSIVTSLGFSYYINNFGRYNTLYGSIGAILVILMWLYFNSIILLIGFELNASIINAKFNHKAELDLKLTIEDL